MVKRISSAKWLHSLKTFLSAEIVPVSYCDSNALYYRRDFKRNREDLLNRLIKLYNHKVFDEKLDNVSISWSKSRLKADSNCEYHKRFVNYLSIQSKVQIIESLFYCYL